MRVGVFGGTFDPIHTGHLIIAEQCREQAKLDEVWFIPSARPPHKPRADMTSFDKRADMLRVAIAGHAQFRVNELEFERPGPSYTADTLSELHHRHPAYDLHLILGSDCLPYLSSWHEPVRIVTQAKLLVVARVGWPVWPTEQLRAALRLTPEQQLDVHVVLAPQIEIASRDLRRRVNEGRTIRYFVPAAVGAFIADKGLYK